MAHLPTLPRKLNPYQNHKFHLLLNGKTVAAFKKLATMRSGKIVLQQGVTLNSKFNTWAKNAPVKPQHIRRNLTIKEFNDAGKILATINIRQSWISNYTSAPPLNAKGDDVEIQEITIEAEGVEGVDSDESP